LYEAKISQASNSETSYLVELLSTMGEALDNLLTKKGKIGSPVTEYRICEQYNEDGLVKNRDFPVSTRNIFEVRTTRKSIQKRGRSQSCLPDRPYKYPRTENPVVGRWRYSICTSNRHSNPSGASNRSRRRSQSSSPHRPFKYLIVDEFRNNRLAKRVSRISSTYNYNGEYSTCTLKCSRSPYCFSSCRPVKYRICEYENESRIIEHRDFTISTRNIFEVISIHSSAQKRSRSQSYSSGRPYKYPRTENPAIERKRSSICKIFTNPIGRALKRRRCRSQSCSPHRSIKYLIVDESCVGRGVERASWKTNTTNSLRI
jgi:hypothetical protein